MQAVQSPHPKARTMAPGQFRAGIPNRFWNLDLKPEPASQIAGQFGVYASSFERTHLLAEHMLSHGVRPFRTVERSKPDPRFCRHATFRLGRMAIRQVERDKETCVRVDIRDAQKRPRSSITRSAPDKTRFPNIFWRRWAKSGQCSGSVWRSAGTMRAITFCRSRSSTVWPAPNNSFNRRVFRNWRIFTEGMPNCDT
jgi:hypothetical protein